MLPLMSRLSCTARLRGESVARGGGREELPCEGGCREEGTGQEVFGTSRRTNKQSETEAGLFFLFLGFLSSVPLGRVCVCVCACRKAATKGIYFFGVDRSAAFRGVMDGSGISLDASLLVDLR